MALDSVVLDLVALVLELPDFEAPTLEAFCLADEPFFLAFCSFLVTAIFFSLESSNRPIAVVF
ncbi:MAG: hypothetical protein AAFQ40_16725, partial [Cyanobacteria bacterium J06623_5]